MSDTLIDPTPTPTTAKAKRTRVRTKDPVLAGMFHFAKALDVAPHNERLAAIRWLAARFLDAVIIERGK